MTSEEKDKLYEQFIQKFPISRLNDLKLTDYTGTSDTEQRDDFTYWVEFKTKQLGGIVVWSNTYGVYKMSHANENKEKANDKLKTDGVYKWQSNLGNSADEAWKVVRSEIVKIASLATQGKFEEIDNLGSGIVSEQFKWKTAFLYSKKGITNIFKKEALMYLANKKQGTFTMQTDFSKLTKTVFDNRLNNNESNFWDVADSLWKEWMGADDYKKQILNDIKNEIEKNDIGLRYVENSNDALHKGKELFIWIGTSDGFIGDAKCHYEFIFSTKEVRLLRTMVHFEEKNNKTDFKDIVKGKGLKRKDSKDWFQIDEPETDIDFFNVDENEIPKRAMDNLIKLNNLVGEDLKKEIRRQKGMKEINKYIDAVNEGKNVILTGAPGTGKTHLAKEIASIIVGQDKTKTNIGFVQFHQSYDYTDFVEGLRPKHTDKPEVIGFALIDGIFKAFCAEALGHLESKYVFIIDEINRGEPSKIFGELFYSIDPGYRVSNKQLAEGGITSIRTQYANTCSEQNVFDKALGINKANNFGHFFVPDNVYIIGTMNDIDRSVESIDFAFRRRFTWIEIPASETQEAILDNLLKSEWKKEAKRRMDNLNAAIWKGKEGIEGLSSSYHIGAAYFLKLNDSNGDFNKLWNYHIAPLLYEYLRGMDDVESKLEKLKVAYDI